MTPTPREKMFHMQLVQWKGMLMLEINGGLNHSKRKVLSEVSHVLNERYAPGRRGRQQALDHINKLLGDPHQERKAYEAWLARSVESVAPFVG